MATKYDTLLSDFSDALARLEEALQEVDTQPYRKEIADKVFAQLPDAVTRFKELRQALDAGQQG